MLIRTPDKNTYMKPQMTLKKPLLNPKEALKKTTWTFENPDKKSR